MSPLLRNLKRRLDRWELDHLRQHAAELAEQMEAAEQRAADTEQHLSWAEDAADSWREEALQMQLEAAEATGGTRGLTMNGQLVIVPRAAEVLYA